MPWHKDGASLIGEPVHGRTVDPLIPMRMASQQHVSGEFVSCSDATDVYGASAYY